MTLIAQVQALQQLAKRQAAPTYICKDAEFEYECEVLNAVQDMLEVLGQFREGDTRCLKAITGLVLAVTGNETTSDEIDCLHRLQAACELIEADQK